MDQSRAVGTLVYPVEASNAGTSTVRESVPQIPPKPRLLQLLKNAIVLNVRPDPEPGDVLILRKVEGTISEGHAGGPDAVAIVNR